MLTLFQIQLGTYYKIYDGRNKGWWSVKNALIYLGPLEADAAEFCFKLRDIYATDKFANGDRQYLNMFWKKPGSSGLEEIQLQRSSEMDPYLCSNLEGIEGVEGIRFRVDYA
jgi:hypothetical protein